MQTSALRVSSRVKIDSQTDDAELIERRRSQLVASDKVRHLSEIEGEAEPLSDGRDN